MMTKHYNVAGHTFAVSGGDEIFDQMGNYEPFACEGGEPLFSLTIDSGAVPEYTEVYPSKKKVGIIPGRTASGIDVFDYKSRTKSEGCLICSKDHHEGRLIMTSDISTTILESLTQKKPSK